MSVSEDPTDLDFQRRAQRLLVEVLALPASQRRTQVLAAAADDPALAEEVLTLLASETELDNFLETPAVVDLQLLPDEPTESVVGDEDVPLPTRIGPYEILARLGSGGMGEVFRARQQQPVRREVAVKRIRANLPPAVRERFSQEQRALARLGHSNVARFFDAGATRDGQPYFAMELVPGEPITRYCDKHKLDVAARLQLFLQVCAGVEHAHRQQILHRDLKPSNVLIVAESGQPIPKVIDFGIAKALDSAETGSAPETGTHVLGTPVYMSPEALDPNVVDGSIDTRADVYSLGVLLYELVCGQAPFARDDSGLLALIGRIGNGSHRTPSEHIAQLPADESTTVARRRGTRRVQLLKTLRGDLDWIVGKAMATDREQRYGSVGELAADIRRHLTHEPVLARPANARYRLRLFARRHRAAFLAAGVALTGLILGVAGLGYGLIKARHEAATAQQALGESRAVSNFLIGLFDASRPGTKPADQITAAELLARGAKQLRTALTDQPEARARFLRAIGDVYVQIGRYDEAEGIFAQAQALLDAEAPPDPVARRTLERSRGVLAFHRGEWKKAERLLRAGTAGLDPASDPATWALAVHNLGVALYKQQRYADALRELQRALQARERWLPADKMRLDQSRSAIAAIQLARGQAAQAAATFRQVLAERRARLGPDHAYVALTLKNLALANMKLGHFDAAGKELRQAVNIQQHALGPDSPALAGTLASLGRLLRFYGDPAQAEAPLRQALAIWRASTGNDNIRSASAMVPLAAVLRKLGRRDEAGTLLRKSLRIRQQLGEPAASLDFPRLYLALLDIDRGNPEQAEPALQRCLNDWQRAYGADNHNLVWPLLGLARIDLARGNAARAARHAQRALDIAVRSYAPGHSITREARQLRNQAQQGGTSNASASLPG